MVTSREALRKLEIALRSYYWATGMDMPSIGVLMINLSHDGCDLQYIGIEPAAVIDWPTLFANIIQQLETGAYSINNAAEVRFESQT